MISFQHLVRQNMLAITFVPQALLADTLDRLRDANIPFTVYHYKSFLNNNSVFNIQPKYEDAIRDAQKRYRDHGYLNVSCMAAVRTPIDPNTLFHAICQFFGDTIDADYDRQQKQYINQAHTEYEYHDKNILVNGPEGPIIPISKL